MTAPMGSTNHYERTISQRFTIRIPGAATEAATHAPRRGSFRPRRGTFRPRGARRLAGWHAARRRSRSGGRVAHARVRPARAVPR
eukprot:4436037-Prymnesium_polylepis.1